MARKHKKAKASAKAPANFKADHHPHFAGHRHAGVDVGENAQRSGPQPGQTEFSADQEQAMRNQAPAPQGPSSMSSMPGSDVEPDNDELGGQDFD